MLQEANKCIHMDLGVTNNDSTHQSAPKNTFHQFSSRYKPSAWCLVSIHSWVEILERLELCVVGFA